MIKSKCGIMRSRCGYKKQVSCKGCVHIDRHFWSNSGKPIEQCKYFVESR